MNTLIPGVSDTLTTILLTLLVFTPWFISMANNRRRREHISTYLGSEPTVYATIGIKFRLLKELLRYNRTLFIPVLYGTHLALIADKDGVRLLSGTRRPREVFRTTWDRVVWLDVGQSRWGGGHFPTLELECLPADPEAAQQTSGRDSLRLLLCCLPERGLGYFPPTTAEFGPFYEALSSLRATELRSTGYSTERPDATAHIFVSIVKDSDLFSPPFLAWVNRNAFTRASSVRDWTQQDFGTSLDSSGTLYEIVGDSGTLTAVPFGKPSPEIATSILRSALLAVCEQVLGPDVDSSIVQHLNAEACWGALLNITPPGCDAIEYHGRNAPRKSPIGNERLGGSASLDIHVKKNGAEPEWPVIIFAHSATPDGPPGRLVRVARSSSELGASQKFVALDDRATCYDINFVPYSISTKQSSNAVKLKADGVAQPEEFANDARNILGEEWFKPQWLGKNSDWIHLERNEALYRYLMQNTPFMLQGVLMFESIGDEAPLLDSEKPMR